MRAKLRVNDVSLELPYETQGGAGVATHSILSTFAATQRRFATVLSSVSFEAGDGDRVGLLGLNGAGKTTLLRVLNGALPPTQGSVERSGTLQSLLSTTLGFNEYATVSENVLLRGTAMGLRYRQVAAAVDSILEFAGLEGKAKHRLYTLSAGQRMRLGFAISTSVQPDILLMDEWIGAGDENFISRAKERMLSRFHGSRIVVLASHSTALLRSMCTKAIVLDRGRMRFFGDISEGLDVYRGIVSTANAATRNEAALQDPLLFGNSVGLIERIKITDGEVEVEGWGVTSSGREPLAVCIEAAGRQWSLQPTLVDRPDVRLHMGKSKGSFGFQVRLDLPEGATADGLLADLEVSLGDSGERLGPPLPVAMAAIIQTQES